MAREIFIERHYPHPIEKVWEAIATSDALAEWLMPNDFQLVVGHEFTFRTQPRIGFDGIVRCKVLGFEAPTRLQYTWQGGPLKKPTVVTFELEPTPDGTKLRFRQSGFEGIISRIFVRSLLGSGWRSLLTQTILNFLQR